MTQAAIGGPAQTTYRVTSRQGIIGRDAQRVFVVSDGRPAEGGPQQAVYYVSDAEIAAGDFVISGNKPIPIVEVGPVGVEYPPIAVYVVTASSESDFPPQADNTNGDDYMQNTVTLTHSDILTIPTKGFELVPTPGTGKAIVPIAGIIVADFPNNLAATGYIASSTIELAVRYGTNTAISHYIGAIDWLVPNTLNGGVAIAFPRIFTGAGDYLGNFYTQAAAIAAIKELPLNLYDDDNDGGPNYTGGDALNTMKVTIIYTTVDV